MIPRSCTSNFYLRNWVVFCGKEGEGLKLKELSPDIVISVLDSSWAGVGKMNVCNACEFFSAVMQLSVVTFSFHCFHCFIKFILSDFECGLSLYGVSKFWSEADGLLRIVMRLQEKQCGSNSILMTGVINLYWKINQENFIAKH